MYRIFIRCFVCDAPAKSSVTYTSSHNSFAACNHCFIKGRHDGKCVVFDKFNKILDYTDDNFKSKSNPMHHAGTSILESIGVKMVTQFPNDYMDLVLLGTMKKLLTYWVKGPSTSKLDIYTLKQFDNFLLSFNQFICKEFQRKHRSTLELAYWKATEFRLFLLYTGPIFLKFFLCEEIYKHFLALHFAIRILCSKKMYKSLSNYAHSLLCFFVETGNDIYEHFVVFNIHNLMHLAKDSLNFGPLDNFSAFKFENYLQKVKKIPIRTNGKFEQLVNRVLENLNFNVKYEKRCHPFRQIYSENHEARFFKAQYMHFSFVAKSIADGVCTVADKKVTTVSKKYVF